MQPGLVARRLRIKSYGGALFAVWLLLCAASTAHAQWSGNASVVSDYRYRAVSFSQGQAEPQLSVAYDDPQGWYLGGMLSGARLYDINTEAYVGYAGYTGKINSGLSWDTGMSSNAFARVAGYNYTEIYFGIAADNFSARIYYSPNYFEQNNRTLYSELNASFPVNDWLQLSAHTGLLHVFSGGEFSSRADFRVAANTSIADWHFQLAWVALQKKYRDYPQYEDLHTRAFLLSATYSF